jgi:hypothetical protein
MVRASNEREVLLLDSTTTSPRHLESKTTGTRTTGIHRADHMDCGICTGI